MEESKRAALGAGGVAAGEIKVRGGQLADISGGKIGLAHSSADGIEAESVRMAQSAARSVRATELSATMAAALQVDAQEAEIRFSSVGLLDADRAEFGQSVVYGVMGQDVSLKSCYAKTAVSQGSFHASQSLIGIAAAREIEASEVRTGILIAKDVRGTVRALLDTKAAAVFGAAFGAAFAAVWLLRRR